MSRIRLHTLQGQMGCIVRDVPAFPGESFSFGIPEAIGATDRTFWFGTIKPQWEEIGDGAWRSTGRQPGELSYVMDVVPTEDTVDIRIALHNESDRGWAQSHAFNCINCGGAPSLVDHECVRHRVGVNGRIRRLTSVPRRFGPRPAVQLYSVASQPAGRDIPFVSGFQSTPQDVALEGWMAVVSRDGKRLMATASRPALYLFQNMEYSCIHSAQSLGAVAPGETGRALTRVYFVETGIEAWYRRMKAEIA